MNYAGIITDDIANGTGIRTSLFVSGCRNNCPGCFNKEQQNFTYGEVFTEKIEDEIISSISDFHAGLTLLGGDPMEPENAAGLLNLVKKFRDKFGYNNIKKTIWIYTGYIYDEIYKLEDEDPRKKLLLECDIIVDGRYVESLHDITLKFKGSKNQRIIIIHTGEVIG